MRYKMIVAYDGRNYVGFQSQINGVAIQDVIESVLYKIFNEKIRIYMASRTDSGVHAYYQVFHFDSKKENDVFRLKGSMNSLLPKDIHIRDVAIVSDNFHSRFDVKRKTYEYRINIGEYDVFLNGYAYQCFYHLDLEVMKEATAYFLGEHDFGSFNTSSYEEYPDQVRTIHRLDMILKGDLLVIEIEGSGFLRHMVRMIVGTLIDLGRGKKTLEQVKDMIEHPNKSSRRYNIEATGLYLKKIDYEDSMETDA